MEIVSDLAMSIEHTLDLFESKCRFHGENCLWCKLRNHQQESQKIITYHPLTSDLKGSGHSGVNKIGILMGFDNHYWNRASKNMESITNTLREFFYFKQLKTFQEETKKVKVCWTLKKKLKEAKEGDFIFLYIATIGERQGILINDEFLSIKELNEILCNVSNKGLYIFIMFDCLDSYIVLDQYENSRTLVITLQPMSNNTLNNYGLFTRTVLQCLYKYQHRVSLSNLLEYLNYKGQPGSIIVSDKLLDLSLIYFGIKYDK